MNHSKRKVVILFILVATAAGGFWYAFSWRGGLHSSFDHSIKTVVGDPIKVARAIDGDTIEFVNGDRLRYIGIDTPEEVDPRKPVQCWAEEAAAANRRLVEGKTVVFTQDVSKRDKYGRWLGFVRLWENGAAGTDVNSELVRQGFAFSYPYKPDVSRAGSFAADEASAKKERLGIWSHCHVYRVGSRKQTEDLASIVK
jgi:micrococcal nuclease